MPRPRRPGEGPGPIRRGLAFWIRWLTAFASINTRDDGRDVSRSGVQMSNNTAIEYDFAISRRDAPEACLDAFALCNQRARGMPGAQCTRSLVRA